VHEGPVLPNKRMTVASIDRSARCGADMSKKQLCLDMSSKRAQITVIPSWQDVFKESRGSAFVIPS